MFSTLKASVSATIEKEFSKALESRSKEISDKIFEFVKSKDKGALVKVGEVLDILSSVLKDDVKVYINKDTKDKIPVCSGFGPKAGECKFKVCDKSDSYCSRCLTASTKPPKLEKIVAKNTCEAIKASDKKVCGKPCDEKYCKKHLQMMERQQAKSDEEEEDEAEIEYEKVKVEGKNMLKFSYKGDEFLVDNDKSKTIVGLLKDGKKEEFSKSHVKMFEKKEWKFHSEAEEKGEESEDDKPVPKTKGKLPKSKKSEEKHADEDKSEKKVLSANDKKKLLELQKLVS
jgi:hypothetical protein